MITETNNVGWDTAQERYFQLLTEEWRANPGKTLAIEDHTWLKFRAGKETNTPEVYEPINRVRVANGLSPWD